MKPYYEEDGAAEIHVHGAAEIHLHGVSTVCEDCGCVVSDESDHARFHSILNSHAHALAVLKTAHLARRVHDKWDVPERIDAKKFDNWSADAFAEVVAPLPEGEPNG